MRRHNALREGRVLKRPEDLHCVAFHLLLMGGYAGAFFLYLRPELAGVDGPWSRAAFVAAAALMLGWCAGIDVGVNFHNHIHRPIFKQDGLNRWFGRLWTVSGGWPAYFWRHSHLVVHHSKLLSNDDWTLPRRNSRGELESLYRYSILHWPWRYGRHLFRDLFVNATPDVRRAALRELVLFVAIWSVPFWIDPLMGLVLWLLPQYLGNVAVMGPGMYAQHAGCTARSPEHPHLHSNTFLNRFFNLTMFNIGYHIEHHERGYVHWADLPALHRKLKRELAESGAHVLTIGYYRGGRLLCRSRTNPDWLSRFIGCQDPECAANQRGVP